MKKPHELIRKIGGASEGTRDEVYQNFQERESLFKGNRFLAQYKVFIPIYIALSLGLLLLILLLVNSLSNLDLMGSLTGKASGKEPTSFWGTVKTMRWVILFWIIGTAAFLPKIIYNVRISQGNINIGQKGTARWTTREELAEQYPLVPIKDESYPGIGGIPIARDPDKNGMYIDRDPVNTMVIGTTRSGKGEMGVFPTIDIYSRAEEKASMVITDPKLELASASIPVLEARGYDCHILNLIDMEYSMGYNPLSAIVQEYKEGNFADAQRLCKALAEPIFPDDTKDPYWNNQGKNVFIAAIMADISDNIEADEFTNTRRRFMYSMKEKQKRDAALAKLTEEKQVLYRIKTEAEAVMKRDPTMSKRGCYEEVIRSVKNVPARRKLYEFIKAGQPFYEEEFVKYLSQPLPHIDYAPGEFKETHENIDKINLYSIASMVNILYSKKLDDNFTALDKYFDDRPEDDFARQQYASIASASEQTKGTIMSVYQNKVSNFILDSVGRMTARNTINMLDIGFGDKPIAIFIGLPDYDPSVWFISSVFVEQLYFTLAKAATAAPGGKCTRQVLFLLDEFGNMPEMPTIESIVSVGLGRNLKCMFIIQSFGQLENTYGKERTQTILENCGNWIFILSTGKETVEAISKALGSTTITTLNRSGRKLAMTKEFTEMHDERPLLDPAELAKLEKGETVILRWLHREDNDRKNIKATPIFNRGRNRMLFRYEYLGDTFITGRLLYRSKNMDNALARSEALQAKEIEMVPNVKLDTTKDINLKKVSRSAEEYLQDQNRAFVFLKDIEQAKQEELFKILGWDQEKVWRVLSADPEEPDDAEYLYTVFDVLEYAYALVQTDWAEEGFMLLEVLDPLGDEIDEADLDRVAEEAWDNMYAEYGAQSEV